MEIGRKDTALIKIMVGAALCNLVWSMHPVMGKWVLEDFSPVEAAWLRYIGAFFAFLLAVVFWPFVARLSRDIDPSRRSLVPRARAADLAVIIAIGLLGFCFSPLMQMTGLAKSRATDNAIIIAVEPLITVLFARAILGEKLKPYHYAAFLFALAGFSLLSGLSWARLNGLWDDHLTGNLILLASLVGEASHSVLSRKVVTRIPPGAVYLGAITAGAISITIAACSLGGLPDPGRFTAASLFGALWMGPIGTSVTYLFWMFALVRVPVASLVIFLFLQPVLGSIWGALFLGDRLTLMQWFGAVLILGGVYLQARVEIRG